MRFFVQSVVCLLVLTVSTGDGSPNGAPGVACATMVPRHNVASQACQANYIIETNQPTYDVNNNIQGRHDEAKSCVKAILSSSSRLRH